VVGIALSLSQGCRIFEPVINAKHALLVFFTATTCCFEGVTTLLLGSASADAQNAIEVATIAHRTGQPHKPLGFVTVVIPQG